MSEKRWEKVEENRYILYFTPYYDEEKIATVCLEDGVYCFSSELLRREESLDYLDENNMDGAKKAVEEIVSEYYEEQRDYYAELLKKWESVR